MKLNVLKLTFEFKYPTIYDYQNLKNPDYFKPKLGSDNIARNAQEKQNSNNAYNSVGRMFSSNFEEQPEKPILPQPWKLPPLREQRKLSKVKNTEDNPINIGSEVLVIDENGSIINEKRIIIISIDTKC